MVISSHSPICVSNDRVYLNKAREFPFDHNFGSMYPLTVFVNSIENKLSLKKKVQALAYLPHLRVGLKPNKEYQGCFWDLYCRETQCGIFFKPVFSQLGCCVLITSLSSQFRVLCGEMPDPPLFNASPKTQLPT